MMVAQGGFDKKEEVENPSEVLLNPSDPEATFRYKAGGRHLGYVGNVVEAVGEKSSLVIVYDYQQNTYADNQFMKDYLNEKKDFSDGSFIVADGAYSGEENSRLASEHNLKLVTTNFTGRKPDEIYADFVFTDDGKYLIKCKNNRVPEDCIYDPGNERSVAYFRISDCEGCPYKERCQSRFLKTRVRKEVSWKSVGRAKQLQYMQTEEFSEYAKFRNGVEAIPSLLRRRYHVDKIPVHGKKRTRLFFGFKIAALDFQKLLDYKKALYFPSCVMSQLLDKLAGKVPEIPNRQAFPDFLNLLKLAKNVRRKRSPAGGFDILPDMGDLPRARDMRGDLLMIDDIADCQLRQGQPRFIRQTIDALQLPDNVLNPLVLKRPEQLKPSSVLRNQKRGVLPEPASERDAHTMLYARGDQLIIDGL